MTSMNTGPRPARPVGESDVYTGLLVVSFLAMLAATIYVAYRAATALGGLLPPGGA
ncbi:MAG: hypothetical protein IPM18_08840 [Phycisphaerales bacterium]|nr:hypothetical protein [Phycisphaerales bacterium]